MRWNRMRRSDNVEDERGASPVGFRLPVKLGGWGLLAVLVLSYFLGINPLTLLGLLDSGPVPQQSALQHPPANDPSTDFVRAVLGDTEDTWSALFQQAGSRYQRPKLVLFRGHVASACGFASAAVGPFYCPEDSKVYLDLSFFDELSRRFGAPGDFARAYVIAHEIGHHVQNLIGISDRVEQESQGVVRSRRNALSVHQELQADCLAGVWGHYARQRGLIDPGDIDAALRAASAIGDDRLQMQARGYVAPDSFTHGTSRQRVEWFQRGIESGDLRQCDTFSDKQL